MRSSKHKPAILFPTDRWVIHFDGSCEPKNPGGYACYGFTAHNPDGTLIHSGTGFVCKGAGATNNVAEYAALEAALYWMEQADLGAEPVACYGDSLLVVKTVCRFWKCKAPHLVPRRNRIIKLFNTHSAWTLQWVPRHQNTEADRLAAQAYQNQLRAERRAKRQKRAASPKVSTP